MAADAAAQLDRLLRLIPVLADERAHPLDEIARRIGTDRKTVLDDIRALSVRYGDPGGFVQGVQIFVDRGRTLSLVSNHFARPMRLTLAELAALELGLALLAVEHAPEDRPVIDRARQRIREVIRKLPPDWSPDRMRYAEMGDETSVRHLPALRKARSQKRGVRIAYRKADALKAEPREVCPYAITYARGHWYLIGHCTASDHIRVFRLDRIGTVEPLETTFERPDDFDPRPFTADGRVFHVDNPVTLRVRYSARIARWIAEREGKEPNADGSLTLDHPLADTDWAVRHVLQYGPDAEVVEPAEIRTAIRERLCQI
jgi:predicted DNA-binding transcriptional regulator YafY